VRNQEKIDRFVSAVGRAFHAPTGAFKIERRHGANGPLKSQDNQPPEQREKRPMTKEFDNNMRGVLFRNDDKQPGDDKERDYQGQIEINGVEFWLSAWIKTSKAGRKFMSLSAKPKNPPAEQGDDFGSAPSKPVAPKRGRDMNDEIPFAPEWR
jgi:hypothetical protein